MKRRIGAQATLRRTPLALLIAIACASGQVAAQDDDATALERIEVTGSRIKKAEIETQVPVLTVTREDIERTGLSSVGDIVQQLTASGSSLNTKFNSSGNFGFPANGGGVGAGSTTVDLRHLGCQRVLVLVDGIRWVNESSASGVSSCTDLNTIPVSIIERIDILEDGASSIYGSDAIAGVVNIITRRQFDGLEVSGYYGENEEGDGETTRADVSVGGSSERADFFLSASYFKQRAIESKDREQAAFPVPGTGLTFGSSATPNGRFIFTDPRCPDGVCSITTPNGQFFPNGPNFPGDFIPFTTANRFNFAQFNLLLTPSERRSLFGQARYRLNDDITWYVRALYNERESLNRAAPEPFFLGPDAGTGNPFADNITISATNPFNPFGIDLISSGPGANLILVGRRPIEGGPRLFEQNVDTWYVATGLEGAFGVGEGTWYWDVNYVSSKNEAEQENRGSYNIRRINLALGPVAACNADPSCVPLDIFSGPGAITPEMLAYISPIFRDRSEQELEILSANLTGDLFEGWAGPVAFATGVEHRDYEGSYSPDALTVAGEYNGVPSLPTAGAYDVDEFYAEFNVPIYAAGDSKLDASLAGRYSDYSTFGSETTFKAGLRWQLSEDFLLRGTYAEGFRAPSIGEAFGSAARFDATIDDPCLIGLDGSAPEGNEAGCDALGVPDGAQQANSQISVTTGGNEDLLPETADSYTLGAVWSPGFASDSAWSDRLDVEVTYYNHEIEDGIQAIDAQTQLDACVANADPALNQGGALNQFCQGITRASTGGINSFNNRLVNIGTIETDGFDFNLFWTLPGMEWGQFKINWLNTFVNDYEAVAENDPLTDADDTEQPLTVGREVNDSGIPEWTSTIQTTWEYADFSAAWNLRHLSDLTEDCGDAAGFPVCSNPTDPDFPSNSLGSTTYHDFQFAWKTGWFADLRLAVGVTNAFDKDPPICLSCSLNGYDASNYDVPGRFWYLKADMKF